jgi:DMSO/TMAO reductase YedYZ molybdopterin-dependent catalytic subunit
MTRVSVPAQTGFLAGVLAALLMTLVMFGLRVATGASSTLELLADGILGVLPAAYFESLLDSLRQIAKPVLYVILVIGQVLVGGAIGQWYARHMRRRLVLYMALGLWAAFGLMLFPVLGLGVFGGGNRDDWPAIAATSFLAFLAFGVMLLTLMPQLKPEPESLETFNRRRFIGWLGSVSAGSLMAFGGWRIGLAVQQMGEPDEAALRKADALDEALRHGTGPTTSEVSFGVTGLPREITPTADFYTVSKNLSFLDPVIDTRTWQLRVDGLVEQTLLLTFEDAARMPSVTDFYTLQCISNEVGGELIGNALWKGFRLADLLDQSGMKPGVKKVVLHCSDDYQVSLRVDRAVHPDTIGAYEMNGAPLSKEHGAPLRVVVPGLYGLMNAKWVRRIELVDYDHKGYWQGKGWSDVATYQTSSRIDVPRNTPGVVAGLVTVGGIAFAGDRGLSGVEVSLDRGKTWLPAEMKPPLSRNAWGLWRYTWNAEPGSYTVWARATDGLGQLQPAEVRGPLPDGATGLPEVSFRIAPAPRPKLP